MWYSFFSNAKLNIVQGDIACGKADMFLLAVSLHFNYFFIEKSGCV
jgi:hypothetical protein